MLPPMQAVAGCLLKSCRRSCYVIRAYRQPSHSTASQQDFSNKTFRIIHPFHPYKNIEFEIDYVKRIAYESRVFFFNTKGRKSSVPLYWTDIGPQDPFVAVSAGRSLFRVADLLGLVRLIGEINGAKRKWARAMIRQDVKEITPLMLNKICRVEWIKWVIQPYKYDIYDCYNAFYRIFYLTSSL